MGTQESKPTFPTQHQWDEYRTEKVNKITEIQEDIANQKREAEELQKRLSKNVIIYMRECQDKAFLKRFIADNSACTQAKEALLEDTMSIAVKLGNSSYAEHKIFNKL